MANYMVKKAATAAGRNFLQDQEAKRVSRNSPDSFSHVLTSRQNGYIISAPEKDQRGRKLSDKNKNSWEMERYTNPLWCIPECDLKILMKVKRNAKNLDAGHHIGPLKFGIASLWGLVPVIGDFGDVILAYFMVYRPARKVSKGEDVASFKFWMKVRIVSLGCVGMVPMVGDLADTIIKWNMRNAAALEKLLLTRAGYFEVLEKEKAAKSGRRQRVTIRHSDESDLEPPPRYETEHHPNGGPSAFSTGHNTPSRFTTGTATNGNTQVSKSGGGWLPGMMGRKTTGRQHVMEEAEIAPARPPRPNNASQISNQF